MSKNKQRLLRIELIKNGLENKGMVYRGCVNAPKSSKAVELTALSFEIGVKEHILNNKPDAVLNYTDYLAHIHVFDAGFPHIDINAVPLTKSQVIYMIRLCKHYKNLLLKHSIVGMPNNVALDIADYASDYLNMNKERLNNKLQSEVKRTIHYLRALGNKD